MAEDEPWDGLGFPLRLRRVALLLLLVALEEAQVCEQDRSVARWWGGSAALGGETQRQAVWLPCAAWQCAAGLAAGSAPLLEPVGTGWAPGDQLGSRGSCSAPVSPRSAGAGGLLLQVLRSATAGATSPLWGPWHGLAHGDHGEPVTW